MKRFLISFTILITGILHANTASNFAPVVRLQGADPSQGGTATLVGASQAGNLRTMVFLGADHTARRVGPLTTIGFGNVLGPVNLEIASAVGANTVLYGANGTSDLALIRLTVDTSTLSAGDALYLTNTLPVSIAQAPAPPFEFAAWSYGRDFVTFFDYGTQNYFRNQVDAIVSFSGSYTSTLPAPGDPLTYTQNHLQWDYDPAGGVIDEGFAAQGAGGAPVLISSPGWEPYQAKMVGFQVDATNVPAAPQMVGVAFSAADVAWLNDNIATMLAQPTITAIPPQEMLKSGISPWLDFSVGPEANANNIVVTAVSDNHALLPDTQIEFQGVGAGQQLRLRTVCGETGTANVVLTASLNTYTATSSFTVEVVNVPAPSTATISGLGLLQPEDVNSEALEISADGNVVAGKSSIMPFRWTAAGGMVEMTLPPNGTNQITPTGLSTDGSVIGGFDDAFGTASPVAYLWTLNNGSFDALPDSFQLNGLSGDGSVAIGHLIHPNPPIFSTNLADQPVRWTLANGMENLDKGGFTTEMSATHISTDGTTIVGYYGIGNTDATSACYWVHNLGGVFELRSLNHLEGGQRAKATAVSADGGVIVGYSDAGFHSGIRKAVRWVRDDSTNTYTIHALDDGYPVEGSEAKAVSADGSRIVGSIGDSSFYGGGTAFVWDANNGQRALLTALINGGATPQPEWSALESANGISADGLHIVGRGRRPGFSVEAFRAMLPLVPPTPAISPIADITTLPDTSAALAFTLTDADTNPECLTVSAESSNPTLVPAVNVSFFGNGANRSVTITPAAGEVGTTTMTLIVSDGYSSSREDFILNVFPPPELPEVAVLPATALFPTFTTLNGTVNPKWADTFYWFVLDGLIVGNQFIPAGGEPVQVSFYPIGLLPGSTHTFSIGASNIAGNANSLTSETFTLPGGPPSVTTLAPTKVTPTKATLNATVNPNQVETTVTFYVGGTAVGSVTVPAGTEPTTVSFDYNAGIIPGQAITYTTSATNLANQNGTGTDLNFNLMSSDATLAIGNSFVWGSNIGWINGRPATNYGFRTGDTVCSGFLWGANVGWIHVGIGEPANGIRYSNTESDYGVNVMPDGTLRGYAWGQNIGWVNFEENGNPRISLTSGNLRGYAWSANVGWINLNTATTTQLAILDTDNDGISDAWENEHAPGNLTILGNPGDSDGDGQSDLSEFNADTDPRDAGDRFRIVNFSQSGNGEFVSLEFTSKTTRFYQVSDSPGLTAGSWQEVGLGTLFGEAGFTTANFGGPAAPEKFYRVSAMRPLAGP